MASGFLTKVFHPDHVACGCRPHITMCGAYNASVAAIVEAAVFPEDASSREAWCQPCLIVWMEYGCGNCVCGPYGLCHICQAAQQPAAD